MPNIDRPLTREQKRVIKREERRAAQRDATLALREAAATPIQKEQRFKFGDMLALAAIPLAYAAMTSDNNFVVGICFAISGLVACIPVAWHDEIKKQYKGAWCLFILLLCLGLFSIIKSENLKRELAKHEGVLEVGNLEAPVNFCSKTLSENALSIFAGDNIFLVDQFPYTLLKMDGERNIIIDRDADGSIKITRLIVFDDRNNKIVKIDEDGYWVDINSQFKHPTKNEITVFDHADTRILSLNLVNKKALVLKAEIKVGNGLVSIIDNAIKTSSGMTSIGWNHNCFLNMGILIEKNGIAAGRT